MTKPIVSYCMTCGKIKLDGVWIDPKDTIVGYTLSHGYCDQCAERVIADTKAELARLKKC